ncbi:hypothetical protein AN640_01670 [Candidatus Epulonipiscium fishelsonii]|uniref:Uncharacterized protein n=1 Tax=Candidatus Epulonipiscium fishelsonii TaxID=77094 RepID=A0ACC8XB83_9FIRM|nr:hypothetical protein AN640_01670 [Epulopiscium sp. SCG-D08WGA-EpuloA1]
MIIVALNGSNRKQYTYGLIKSVADILNQHEINIEIINLFEYEIKECIGCERCILTNKCVLKDDTQLIMNKLVQADGIILASPVYMQNLSGKLKTFIDRTCKWFHRPEVYGKPVLALATTKGSGLKNTLTYLEKVIIQWGGINAGIIGRNVRTINEPVSLKECNKIINYLKNPKYTYAPSLESLINFQVQKVLSDHMIENDKKYWQEKDWYNKSYYFDCKISFIKQLIVTQFYKMFYKKIHSNKKFKSLN